MTAAAIARALAELAARIWWSVPRIARRAGREAATNIKTAHLVIVTSVGNILVFFSLIDDRQPAMLFKMHVSDSRFGQWRNHTAYRKKEWHPLPPIRGSSRLPEFRVWKEMLPNIPFSIWVRVPIGLSFLFTYRTKNQFTNEAVQRICASAKHAKRPAASCPCQAWGSSIYNE